MANGKVEGAFTGGEGTVGITPDVTCLAEPEPSLGGAWTSIPDNIFEKPEFAETPQDHGVGFVVGDVVLGVCCLYGAELEEIDDLHAVAEGPVEETPPAFGAVAWPVSHAVVVNFLVRLAPDSGPQKVEVEVVHLHGGDGHLEDVVLAPWLGHAFGSEYVHPLMDFPEVAVLGRVVGGVVGPDAGVRQVLSQNVGAFLDLEDAMVMQITLRPVVKSGLGGLGLL